MRTVLVGRLAILAATCMLVACSTWQSAEAVRSSAIDDAHDLLTSRMRDRWDDAAPEEKIRWQEAIELIEALQRSAEANASGGGDLEWAERLSDAFLQATDDYATLLESGAPARERNAQLRHLGELGEQLLGG